MPINFWKLKFVYPLNPDDVTVYNINLCIKENFVEYSIYLKLEKWWHAKNNK